MPSEDFMLRHYSMPPAVDRPHFRGTRYAHDALPATKDPGWEDTDAGRRIRVHGPFLVTLEDGVELECHDGWLHVNTEGELSVAEETG